MSISNLALQTFLELQTIKAMINNTKIELWQANTIYDMNKPVRYDGKLYICNTAHTSGESFDLSKFDVLEASSSVSPENIPFSNENFSATDIEAALIELFTNASNGKSSIATAVLAKGVNASSSDSFATLATKIGQITTGGGIDQIIKLNVSAPYTKTIVLDNARTMDNLCTTILEFINDYVYNNYNCGFDNSDASNFDYSSSYVYFNGEMRLKDSFNYSMTDLGTLGDGTLYESGAIIMANFNEVASVSADETGMTVTGVSIGQVIKASGNIDLTGISRLDGITLGINSSGGGKVRMAVSVDGGTTWKTYYSGAWVTFNPDNISDFATYGMTKAVAEGLTFTQWEALRGSSTTIKFAYYLERTVYTDTASTDSISLNVLMPGYFQLCSPAKYTLSYDPDTKTITYQMNTSGTYNYNYID